MDLSWLGARPITARVEGSPVQPGDRVLIAAAIDVEVCDVSALIGLVGDVEYLEYSCGCGQVYPHVPMIGVRFENGLLEEFWPEEVTVQIAGADRRRERRRR